MCDTEMLSKIATISWGLWRHRNDIVWQEASKSTTRVVHDNLNILFTWTSCNLNSNGSDSGQRDVVTKWVTPPEGMYKANVDGGIQGGNRGVGMVMRDDTGSFIGGFAFQVVNQNNLEIVEAIEI